MVLIAYMSLPLSQFRIPKIGGQGGQARCSPTLVCAHVHQGIPPLPSASSRHFSTYLSKYQTRLYLYHTKMYVLLRSPPVRPRTGHEGPERGGWSTPRPGRFTPGTTWYLLYRRLGGPQSRSGRVRKISPPPEFDPRTAQPVASRYTD
jgi:hypothetical protein